ncbi:enoyl-CoA hydratase/isomerase family protein [Achromobacter sp.]|uniref:enoyl-CoA hydratase/isomerase family protein n=1 Tax=Achromobacter sp. TaxID=134375 RepID=UPI003C789D75
MIKIEESDRLAVITYDRGERRNALSLQAMNALIDVAHRYQSRVDITAIVLAGSAQGFSAGVDLKDPQRWAIEEKSLDERRYLASTGARMCKAWESLPQLTIAAIEGFNVGGGIALTLACDWRVMADNAFLFVPEVQIGIPLVWHTVPRLVSMVGASRAKQIMMLGDRMPAATALEWGLADWLAPAGATVERATALARQVAKSPSHVIKMSKESVNAHAHALNFVSTYMDVDQALVCGQSAEARLAREKFM